MQISGLSANPILLTKGRLDLARIIKHEKPIHGHFNRPADDGQRPQPGDNTQSPTQTSAPLPGLPHFRGPSPSSGSERAAVTKTFAHRAANAVETHSKIN